MARRKKKSLLSGFILIIGILFIISLLLSLISQYKGFFLGLFVIGLILFVAYRIYQSTTTQSQTKTTDTSSYQNVTKLTLASQPQLHIASHRVITPEFCWYGKGTQIRIGNYLINDPMTYYSEGNPSDIYSDDANESSCICASLPVGTALAEAKGALGYWPHYSRIMPNQRANYLEWLAGGRKGTLTDIGYAFIFFYGLERRSLIEKKEIGSILQEVILLLTRYSDSGSFNNYLGNFVAYAVSRAGLDKINHEQFRFLFERTPVSSSEEGLAVGLAWLYKNTIPLPVSWAKKIANFDPRTPKSVVIDRFPAKFNQLFSLKYKERFNNGIVLSTFKKDRGIDYVPASPTFRTASHLNGNNPLLPTAIIPNVIGLQHQFDPIVDIWNQCVEELKPLNRKVSRGISTGSRESYEALPDDLRKLADHPDRLKWNKVIEKYAGEDGFAIPKISVLAEAQGLEKKFSLTIKESIGLAETAGYMKLAIEPDPRITKLPYKWDDTIALYYPAEGKTVTDNPHYMSASFILELGISIAYADGFFDKKEASQISQSLDYLFSLDPLEVQRLEALKQVLVHQKPSLQNLKKRFQKHLSETDIEKVSGFLISIANADGSISQNEVSVLKKIYKTFGVEPEKVKGLVASLQSPPTEPVVVRERRETESTGEKIPERISHAQVIILDRNKLNKKIKDTEEVSTRISDAMRKAEENDLTSVSPNVAEGILNVTSRKNALDRRYYKVLAIILKMKKCEKNTFERYARECGTMPNDAIDAINNWSLDRYGELLLKDGDIIYTNESVFLRIKNELTHHTR